MKTLFLESAVWKEGKFYVAQCLNVDVSSFGKTKKEALKNLQEALELYFEDESIKPSKIASVEKPELTRLPIAYA
ncbi:MAG: type II toxin-antitoxin system HicB family antitoxin [Patescibacteria group bacterium]|nr:type II toxin-antitoxin system HicB family antitoxin [Patescibacteria group bacterium]